MRHVDQMAMNCLFLNDLFGLFLGIIVNCIDQGTIPSQQGGALSAAKQASTFFCTFPCYTLWPSTRLRAMSFSSTAN
jgi:hypothetical protein